MPILKLSTLFAIMVAFGLALGAAPQPALAQTAKKLKCNGCVKSKQIKNGKVKGKDLKDSTVTGSKIAPNAVDGSKVSDDSLTALDLSDEAGADFAADITSVNLAGPAEIVQTVTITAPRAGVVIVNASGYFTFNSSGTVRCNITTDTSASGDGFFNSTMDAAANLRDAWGSTRAFEVPAGAFTVNLVCEEVSAQAIVFFPHLNAVYVPTRY